MSLPILSRRINKIDSAAGETTLFYYNYNWQVLAEYDDSNNLQRKFIYGNYIDEVLLMIADGNDYYYAHDHLYSPAALVYVNGTVRERYEYDAYGNCSILEPNFAPDPDGKSDYGNPYCFQGKRLDLLDNSSLELMYWPYRYYSTYLGRWTQAEKLGLIPNDDKRINPFDVHKQYKDGLNLYGAFAGNPLRSIDSYGLLCLFREYRQSVMAGGGIPHAGILIGVNEDIDYGPAMKFPIATGLCPWPLGGVEWGKTITWDLGIKKTPKRIKYGHPERPLCCCATCDDVTRCIYRTCFEWHLTKFILFFHDCWRFVAAVKGNCCLQRK